MDYEQKYNNALKEVQELYKVMRVKSSTDALNTITALKEIFPELVEAESEDEKIRNALIAFIKRRDRSGCDYDYDQWVAWLEKQHTAPHNGVCFYCYGHRWDMCARDNGIEIVMDGKPVRHFSYKDCEQTFGGKSVREAINEVKVDNSNSVNNTPYDYEHATITQKDFAPKQEPKFMVGDWVVLYPSKIEANRKVVQISRVERCQLNMYWTTEGTWFGDGTEARLWTLADVKDCDVLHSPSRRLIWIYKDNEHYHACIDMNYVTENIDIDGLIKIPSDVCPATSVQRAILFSKMEGAGYEWSEDTHEVKKIEREDEEYNGEDYGIDSLYHAISILEKTLGEVEGYQSDDGILEHKCAITAVKKLYKKKPAEWSEEDEKMIDLLINIFEVNYPEAMYKCNPIGTTNMQGIHSSEIVKWLESLKERMKN